MELGVVRLRVHCNTFAENQLRRIPIDPFWGISLSTVSYYGIGDRGSIHGSPVSFFNLLKSKRNLLYIRNQSVPRSKQFPPRL